MSKEYYILEKEYINIVKSNQEMIKYSKTHYYIQKYRI